MLTVACSRCERRGPYPLDKLIVRHGADTTARVIVPRADRHLPEAGLGRADGAMRHPDS